MRTKSLAAAALTAFMLVPATAVVAKTSDKAAVEDTIRAIFARTNAGDGAGTLALCATDGSIIDEFAPYRWEKFADWWNAFGAYAAGNGITKAHNRIVRFVHVNVAGNRAYAVVDMAFTEVSAGKAHSEKGTDVIALAKGPSGWRAESFAWLGKAGTDSGADADAVLAAAKSFAAKGAAPTDTIAAVTDEFPPFHWTGAGASADWSSALAAVSAKEGTTDLTIGLSAPTQLSVNGPDAYAVFPTLLTFKVHGKTQHERGSMAFALAKAAGGWNIVSWSWATK